MKSLVNFMKTTIGGGIVILFPVAWIVMGKAAMIVATATPATESTGEKLAIGPERR